MNLPERRSDDLERPPMAWLPVVVVGGLALFGAISLVRLAISFIFSTLGVLLIVTVIAGVIYVLAKGYRPD